MSVHQLRHRVDKFPEFFTVYSLLLLMLAFLIGLLTYLLQKVI
jgi:hypothetical protein